MSIHIASIGDGEAGRVDDAGLGCLRTERGNLPLASVDAAVSITGLVARTVLTQGFHNPHPMPVEATYIFPLPDRAAVTAMRMDADGREIEARLGEREQARQAYDEAIAAGRRAAIAEEERADVFTMRVGNILPGERVSITLTMVGQLSYEDGEATYRLPLVVAPRYIPGACLPGERAGTGHAPDTDAVPDASRITPPVLLPGFPDPVALSIGVTLDPAGFPLATVRSSLHAVQQEGSHLRIEPGERLNRDFILRLEYGQPGEAAHSLVLTPDAGTDEGTFQLTVLPPKATAPPRPRDLVLLLDRSGSMSGWKMVAARRAAARIVDTLGASDRFAVLAFDHLVSFPEDLGGALVGASDRNRFRAVRHLAGVQARGGTELLAPLTKAIGLLSAARAEQRDLVLVLVTDGQVGNEDQIVAAMTPSLSGIRVHTVGVDQAVNAGFLGRLAAAGGGRCELVESEDRLDVAMQRIHRRIAAPVVAGLSVTYTGIEVDLATVTPARLPELFPGAPLMITGRYRDGGGEVTARVTGRTRSGTDWSAMAVAARTADPAVTVMWARSYLGDLEDRYAAVGGSELEQRLIDVSLRFSVLCRYTAWLAEDTRLVTDGAGVHRITQPVEQPAGWELPGAEEPMARAITMAPRGRDFLAAAPAPAMRRMAFEPSRGPQHATGDTTLASARQASAGPAPVLPASERLAETAGQLRAEITAQLRAEITAQLRAEIERLRAATPLADLDRREVLADVGSRLTAMLRDLPDQAGAGNASDQVGVLREIAARLDEDAILGLSRVDFEALWDQSLAALTGFVGGAP